MAVFERWSRIPRSKPKAGHPSPAAHLLRGRLDGQLQPASITTRIHLRPEALAVDADGYTLGILLRGSDEDAKCASNCFVRVQRICTRHLNPLREELTVYFDGMHLPAAFSSESIQQHLAHAARSAAHAPISRYPRGWRYAVAWLLNIALLFAVTIGLLVTALANQGSHERLQAISQPESVWRKEAAEGVVAALLQSLLLIDTVKVLTLTFTSSTVLDRMIFLRVVQPPMRRLHKVLDAIL